MGIVDDTLNAIIKEVSELEAEFNAKAKAIENKYNVKLVSRKQLIPLNVCIDANIETLNTTPDSKQTCLPKIYKANQF